jgi:hypothetical protein
VIAGVAADSFTSTQGEARQITGDKGSPTRDFCGNCGTYILIRAPELADMVIVKVGTLDQPEDFGGPDIAVYTCEAYPWHGRSEGCTGFDKLPG